MEESSPVSEAARAVMPQAAPTTTRESSTMLLPLLRRAAKKRLPTPKPTQYTNRAVPMEVTPSGTLSLKCPASRATKRTPELPKEMPLMLILPNAKPKARMAKRTNAGLCNRVDIA